MKAVLIDEELKQLLEVSIAGKEEIVHLIGHDTIISDEIGPHGDRLFFDEECFIRGANGRFRVDPIAPVAGRAVITGATGAGDILSDARSTVRDIEQRITWLD